MGGARFDVLLHDTSGVTVTRTWSGAELLMSVAWIKRMNARGSNIYIRPSGEHGLALLDSMKAENLADMQSKGFAPAITIQLSGNEFQAWVKLSNKSMPEKVRRLAEAGLAKAFAGTADKLARDGYGRLAGCVGYSVGANGPERHGYALAHSGNAEIGMQINAYVKHVEKTLQKGKKEQEREADDRNFPNLERLHFRDR